MVLNDKHCEKAFFFLVILTQGYVFIDFFFFNFDFFENEGRGRERERNIERLPPICALTRNQNATCLYTDNAPTEPASRGVLSLLVCSLGLTVLLEKHQE